MDFNLTQVIISALTIFGGASFWAYQAARAEHREKETAFNQRLVKEVEELKSKIDLLIRDKEELLLEIATLRSELAAAKTELHAMTTAIRYGKHKGEY